MEIDEASNQTGFEPNARLSETNAIAAKLSSGELILCEKQGRSKVWEIFAKIVDGDGIENKDFVSCRNCKKLFRYNNRSTSNLVKHKCYYLKSRSANGSKVEVDEVKQKCYSLQSESADGSKVEVEEVKQKCYSLQSESVNGSKVEVDEGTKKVITKVITKWVIQNCRPYNLIKDSGLQAILQEFLSIGAKYGANIDVGNVLPHPTKISRNVSDCYDQCFVKVKNEIALIKDNGFGLTTDIWTDDYLKKSYIALTIHFLKNGDLSTRLLGLQSMEGERCTSANKDIHSHLRPSFKPSWFQISLRLIELEKFKIKNGENIFEKVQKLLKDFDCEFSSRTIIVTDRVTNMIKAFQTSQHIACISNLLNNTLQKSVEEVSEVAELSNSCAKLVKYFKQSGLNANLSASLKSYCPTRWNTVFYMLNSIKENWAEINHNLQSKNELHRIDAININYLKAVTKTLQPFEEAIKTLEGENDATLHLVLIYHHQLKKICETNGGDLDIIKLLKEKLLFYLDTTVKNNITIFHKIALFLYPPTNKLLQCSNDEKQFIEDKCVQYLKCFQNESPTIREEFPTTYSPVSKHAKLFLDFVEPESNCNANDIITQELQFYKNTRIVNTADFNVFSWWELQKNNFPLLYKLSCIVLATPASSASSKRIFSAAGNLLSEQRSTLGLKDTGVNQIMFIHSNGGQDEL